MNKINFGSRIKKILLSSLCNPICAYAFLGCCIIILIKFIAFGIFSISDFMQDYGAGIALRHGSSIYGSAITDWARTLAPNSLVENFHPPFVAVLMYVLSALRYVDAAILLQLLSLAAYLYLIVLFFSFTWKKSRIHGAFIIGVLLVWPPFLFNAYTIQLSVFLALLICVAGKRVCNKDDWFAGTLLACASMIKLFPLAFILYLFFARRWIAFISMFVTLLILFATTIIVVGIEDVHLYITSVMSRNVRGWNNFPINQSLLGVVSILFNEGEYTAPLLKWEINVDSIYLPFAFGIVFLAALRSRVLFMKGQRVASFCLFATAVLIASPISWTHGLVILLFPIAKLVQEVKHGKCKLSTAAWTISLLSFPDLMAMRFMYAQFQPELVPWYFAILVKAPFFGLILLCATLFKVNKCTK